MPQKRSPPRLRHGIQDLVSQAPGLCTAGEEGWVAQIDSPSKAKTSICGCARGPVHGLSRQRSAKDTAQRSCLLSIERDQAGVW